MTTLSRDGQLGERGGVVCHVCQLLSHDDRTLNEHERDARSIVIETSAFYGARRILKLIEPYLSQFENVPTISLTGLDRHLQQHVALRTKRARQVMADVMTEYGILNHDAEDRSIVLPLTAYELIYQDGIRRIVSGEVQPDIKETLTAAKEAQALRDSLEAKHNKSNADLQLLSVTFNLYLEAMYRTVSREQWAAIAKRVKEQSVRLKPEDSSFITSLADKFGGDVKELPGDRELEEFMEVLPSEDQMEILIAQEIEQELQDLEIEED